MKLRLIGYWEGPHAEGWPTAQNFVDPAQDRGDVRVICGYLEDGAVARKYRGLSKCRFCGEFVGSLERTDGVYIWPDGLAHYVREHSVRLPDEFLAHARRMGETLECAEIETEWWRRQEGLDPDAA